jgi:cyclophilin family peptidyl-prolyl cis-trans isomerase
MICYNQAHSAQQQRDYMKKNIFIVAILSLLAFGTFGCEQKTILDDNMKTATNGVLSGQEDLYAKHEKVVIKTNYGEITVEFYGKDSPITVNNFLNLAKNGFYNGTKFHRVIKDFMIQGGDPNSREQDISTHGTGGPGYKFMDEINNHKLVRGSLAMANSGPGTNGSQFFIVTKEATPWLDGNHTNFGRVVSGMDVVTKIEDVQVGQNDHPIEDVVIESIELK